MDIRNKNGKTIFSASQRLLSRTIEDAAATAADLSNASLRRSRLKKCSLDELRAEMADFWGSDFTGSNMACARLRAADLRMTAWKDCCLAGADLRDTDLRGAFFSNTILEAADLRGALLSCPSIWGCDLRDVLLSGAMYQHRGEVEFRLHRPPIAIAGYGRRIVIFEGYVLCGAELFTYESFRANAPQECIYAKISLDKITAAEPSHFAKTPMPKIRGGMTAI